MSITQKAAENKQLREEGEVILSKRAEEVIAKTRLLMPKLTSARIFELDGKMANDMSYCDVLMEMCRTSGCHTWKLQLKGRMDVCLAAKKIHPNILDSLSDDHFVVLVKEFEDALELSEEDYPYVAKVGALSSVKRYSTMCSRRQAWVRISAFPISLFFFIAGLLFEPFVYKILHEMPRKGGPLGP